METSEIVDKYRNDKGALIQILLDIQRQNRWLSKDSLFFINRELKIPLTRIYHAATFYKAFSLEPRGKHMVTICTGTACHVRGAPMLLGRVSQKLGIRTGQMTRDERFTLTTVNCLGCCALGPVVAVDNDYYSNPSGAELDKILTNYD
jgi:NADH-quinone oxidoreductase subunit E